jgi:hypothetical protein
MIKKNKEDNLILDLAINAPIFILNGRVFYGKRKEGSFIVKEGPKLDVLERRSYSSSNHFKKQAYKFFFNSDNLNNSNNSKYNNLENFVLNEVLCYLDNSNFDLEELMDEDKVEQKGDLDFKASEKEIQKTKELMLKKLNLPKFDFDNFAIYNEGVYSIQESVKGSMSIGDNSYNLKKILSLEQFNKIYIKKLIASQIDDFVPEYILKQRDKPIKPNKSDFKDCGYTKYEDFITVWIRVNDYVLKDPSSEDYYAFKHHRLAMNLGWNNNHPILSERPYPLGDVDGPFYGYNDFCMGGYSFNFLDKDPSGKNFAKVLLDGRNIVYHGYTKNCNPMVPLYKFEDRLISPKEIARRKLNVTNVNFHAATRRT